VKQAHQNAHAFYNDLETRDAAQRVGERFCTHDLIDCFFEEVACQTHCMRAPSLSMD
jgi:hypothetical protein